MGVLISKISSSTRIFCESAVFDKLLTALLRLDWVISEFH